MKVAKKTIMGGRRIAALSVCTGYLLSGTTAMAAISYSYENDNKTLVVTVDSTSPSYLQNDEYQAALNNNTVTNLVKRGAGTFAVNGTAQKFTGDVRIEDGKIQLRGTNPLGTSGRIYVPGAPLGGNEGRTTAKSLVITQATVGKDIVTESGGTWSDNRTLDIWGTTSTMNGKLLYGDHNTYLLATAGTVFTFNGGVGDIASSSFSYFMPSGGATFIYSGTPYDSKSSILIKPVVTPSYPLDSQGFVAHFIFSVAGNRMTSFGLYNPKNDYWAHWCELKTTVDWAFNKNDMNVYLGHDAVWDLCGTEQRIGQIGVAKIASGYKPPVVTNSFTTPATLHMRQIFGQDSTVPNIRIGGNLSVIYEGSVNTMTIDHEITAKGDLTLDATGTFAFTANGSWVNAKNVTVSNGKMTIANPNALGNKANVNLKSSSSLDISSGVTVTVRTLTVNGESKAPGDYTFGSGTLHVTGLPGLVISVK